MRRVSVAMTRLDGVLVASGLALLAGCTELDAANDLVCDVSGECTPGDPEPQDDPRWACLDQTPPALPPPRPPSMPVGFIIPVLEWGSLASLAGQGLTAALCDVTAFDCTRPLAPPYTTRSGFIGNTPLPPEANGAAGIPIFEGFDGFVKFTVALPPTAPPEAAFVPLTYYLGGRVNGDVTQGPPIVMLNRGSLANVFSQSFGGVDPMVAAGGGIVVVGAFDCNGAPVDNARIEINQPGAIPFVLPASRIPISQSADEPLYTGPSGLAGYLNVTRAVQVRAFRGNDTEPFGTGQFGAVAGEISVFGLRPAFLNDANVRGAPPIERAPSSD
jgi:hypothetical protein